MRAFCVESDACPLYGWVFSGSWSERDNTPLGAAQRIIYALRHGVPENWRDQRDEHDPLSYKEIKL
jgi:hypothetical protein